jgi:hypothetical protein
VTLDLVISDRTVWKWTSSGVYSMRLACVAFFYDHTALCGAREVWQIRAPHEPFGLPFRIDAGHRNDVGVMGLLMATNVPFAPRRQK